MAGEIDKVKGRVKKAVGELTDNQKMKNEGTIDKITGSVKNGIEKVRKAVQGKPRH
jgi:uncharacterized protein YjbJ (UPF0337 family)